MSRSLVRAAFAVAMLSLVGCSSVEEGEEEEVGETVDQAYTGRLAELTHIGNERAGSPASWAQPDSEGIFGQNGY